MSDFHLGAQATQATDLDPRRYILGQRSCSVQDVVNCVYGDSQKELKVRTPSMLHCNIHGEGKAK